MGTVAVVIPTLNASRDLASLLDSLDSQTVRPDSILIIDSDSSDDTVAIARARANVEVISIARAEFDHGLTRDQAFRATSADFVCFLTQDALPASSRYLAELLAPFDDAQVALVSGRQVPRDDARRYEQLVRAFSYPAEPRVATVHDVPRLGIRAFLASDTCSAYRREPYLAAGGFGRCETNEDMLMAARLIDAGWAVAYAPSAAVIHSHNLSLGEQYRRNVKVGRFLEQHDGLFQGSGEAPEGVRLVRYVLRGLLAEHRPAQALRFVMDCAARLAGNRVGRMTARKEPREPRAVQPLRIDAQGGSERQAALDPRDRGE